MDSSAITRTIGSEWREGRRQTLVVWVCRFASVWMKAESCDWAALLSKLTCWINVLTCRLCAFDNLASCTPTFGGLKVLGYLLKGLSQSRSKQIWGQTVRKHSGGGLLWERHPPCGFRESSLQQTLCQLCQCNLIRGYSLRFLCVFLSLQQRWKGIY